MVVKEKMRNMSVCSQQVAANGCWGWMQQVGCKPCNMFHPGAAPQIRLFTACRRARRKRPAAVYCSVASGPPPHPGLQLP